MAHVGLLRIIMVLTSGLKLKVNKGLQFSRY